MNTTTNISDYTWHGLKGRYSHYPGPAAKKTQFLVVYGQHASLERNAGILEALSSFGDAWSPDMPGFGGMDSFYKIGKKPTVDNYAEYLKDFIEKYIGNAPLVVIGISYGFANVTRMLQKYPHLQKQVSLVVSFVGFTSARDFHFKPRLRRDAVVVGAKLGRSRVGAKVAQLINQLGAFDMYYRLRLPKPEPYDKQAKRNRKAIARQKGDLWRLNDRRTHAFTAHDFVFDLDLRDIPIPMTVHHLGVSFDHYFDHDVVLEHMKEVYKEAVDYTLNLPNHSPTENLNAQEVMETIPAKLLDIIRQLP